MFVRWKERKLRRRTEDGKATSSLYAVLVESRRIDGKPRQKVIKYLSHINRDQLQNEFEQRLFWNAVNEALTAVKLTALEQGAIRTRIAEVVPIPLSLEWSFPDVAAGSPVPPEIVAPKSAQSNIS